MPEQPGGLSSTRSDRLLADAVRRKDRKATAEFVQLHADLVYRYIRGRVRPNDADADDLVQEVFLAAYKHIGDYRGDSSLRAWLVGIARHKVEEYYRARVTGPDLEEAETSAATDPPLEAVLDQRRERERTLEILDRLPESDRLLLKWRYWDGKRTSEIAGVLGRTDKAIERMLARARQRFRRQWEARQ